MLFPSITGLLEMFAIGSVNKKDTHYKTYMYINTICFVATTYECKLGVFYVQIFKYLHKDNYVNYQRLKRS